MISDGVEDEEKWLTAGIAGLQQNAFYMHRALVTPSIDVLVSVCFTRKGKIGGIPPFFQT